jgi:hypothetical protein
VVNQGLQCHDAWLGVGPSCTWAGLSTVSLSTDGGKSLQLKVWWFTIVDTPCRYPYPLLALVVSAVLMMGSTMVLKRVYGRLNGVEELKTGAFNLIKIG